MYIYIYIHICVCMRGLTRCGFSLPVCGSVRTFD